VDPGSLFVLVDCSQRVEGNMRGEAGQLHV